MADINTAKDNAVPGDIRLADRVELRLKDIGGRIVERYKSWVHDLTPKGIVVALPAGRQRPVGLGPGSTLEVAIDRGFICHTFDSVALRRIPGRVPCLLLAAPAASDIKKAPRRDFYRVETQIYVVLRRVGDGMQSEALMCDLGVGGCRLVASEGLPLEVTVELAFSLEVPVGRDTVLQTQLFESLPGVVRSVIPVFAEGEDSPDVNPEHYSVGVEFAMRTKTERDVLLRYVAFRQRQLRRGEEDPAQAVPFRLQVDEKTPDEVSGPPEVADAVDETAEAVPIAEPPENDESAVEGPSASAPMPPPKASDPEAIERDAGHAAIVPKAPIGMANGKTVLLAEDEVGICQMLAECLQREGYRLLTASNGEQALRAAEHVKVDLLVTDLMMPRMNGWSLIRNLRQQGMEMPVLVITGYMYQEGEAVIESADIAGFLPKPIDILELIDKVNGLLFPQLAPRRKRLLLLEDGGMIQSLGTKAGSEYETLTVATADEGLERLQAFAPDLVLLDVLDAAGEGVPFFRSLRSRPATAKLPVLVVSGPPPPEILRQMVEMRVSGYAVKPLTVKALMKRVANLVQTLPQKV